MKKLILISILLLCGCSNNDKTIITIRDNLNFEYNDQIMLYDLVDIQEGTIKSENTILDTSEIGSKKISFTYLNNDNKEKQYSFKINIVDTTNPIIFSANTFYGIKGEKIDLVNKIVCGDNYDRHTKCEIIGDYDINKLGEYKLKWLATDSSNNKSEKDFKLVIQKKTSTSSTTTKTYLNDIITKYKTDKTMIGIDVSKWQSKINWDTVKKSGIEFAMIRIGYGHNSDNEINMDTYFLNNIKEAKNAGIKVGIYFYSYAKNNKEAIEQANWIIKELNGETIDLPIAFDWEIWNRFNTYELNFVDLNNIAESFISTLERNNYNGMIYGSKNYLESAWNLPKYPTWLAHYTTKTDYSKDYYIWQLCSNGRVNGINGDVDLDILYK